MEINKIRKLFSWFDNNKNIIYADTAATSLKPKAVIEAVKYYYDHQCTNPHNNDSLFTNQAYKKVNQCRDELAIFLNCDKDEIIYTSGTTESINLIASAIRNILKKDDEIILTKYEHSSNLLPWYNLRNLLGIKIIFVDIKNNQPTKQDFLNKITSKTKLVSFTGVSNLSGLSFDINEISNAIKKKNSQILVCVDLAQTVAHKKCDIKKWNVDFAALSSHKMLGPTGIGMVFIKKELQNIIDPLRFGGGMNLSINPIDFCYIDGVEKFEGGTLNVAGIYGWSEAIRIIKDIGYDMIQKQEKAIYDLLYEQLKDCSNIEVYNWECHSSIFIFNIKGVFCQDVASYLGKKNILVRSGLSCAKLMDKILNTEGVVRASFYVYNTLEEVQRFVDVLKNITKEDIYNEII